MLCGKKRSCTTLPLSLPPWTVPAGGVNLACFFAAFTSVAKRLAAVLRSCLADGIRLPFGTTFTLAFIPGCTTQKYVNVPAFVNLSVYGLAFPSGTPEPLSVRPFSVLPPWGKAPSGFRSSCVWPLNQNGEPAASVTPLYLALASGMTNAGAPLPFFGNVTLWKPLNFQRTLSPVCTVTVLREYPSTSPVALPPITPLEALSGPAITVLVVAAADAGMTSATAKAASASLDLLVIHRPFSGCEPEQANTPDRTALGLLVVVRVDLGVLLPLVGQLVLGEAGVDRAGLDAGIAVDALVGVDEELGHVVVIGLFWGGMDAVDRADLDAGIVLRVDAGLCDDVCHFVGLLVALFQIPPASVRRQRTAIVTMDQPQLTLP